MLPFTHDGNSYMKGEILAAFVAGRKGPGNCGPRHASNLEGGGRSFHQTATPRAGFPGVYEPFSSPFLT